MRPFPKIKEFNDEETRKIAFGEKSTEIIAKHADKVDGIFLMNSPQKREIK